MTKNFKPARTEPKTGPLLRSEAHATAAVKRRGRDAAAVRYCQRGMRKLLAPSKKEG